MSAVRIGRPGEPVRLVYEQGPKLTERQEKVLHVCRSFRGNRHRTARHLGVSHAAVQTVLAAAARAGARVPPPVTRKGVPNSGPSKVGPRCGRQLQRGICGRRLDHPSHCRTEQALRERVR